MATRLLPDVVPLTPTSYEAYTRCPRLFLDGHVLAVPASDPAPSADRGLLLHDMLRLVHEQGSCRDDDNIREVLAGHGADDEYAVGVIARHARRCPTASERAAHEVDVARFHRIPPPMFMVTARIDAIWVHDGLLDARDYKTGTRWYERVADDPRARVQAFALAAAASQRGLSLRLRYEYLAPEVDDDPEPYAPDDDDVAGIEEELRAAVAKMWGDDPWRGVADPVTCGTCRYRSICPDSAAPGVPQWPVLSVGGSVLGRD